MCVQTAENRDPKPRAGFGLPVAFKKDARFALLAKDEKIGMRQLRWHPLQFDSRIQSEQFPRRGGSRTARSDISDGQSFQICRRAIEELIHEVSAGMRHRGGSFAKVSIWHLTDK